MPTTRYGGILRYNEFTMLLEFSEYLINNCKIVNTQPILVGYSGGPDSLCLLHMLKALRYPLVVAHLDHSLRIEAENELKTVIDAVKELDLPLEHAKYDVKKYARSEKLSIEEAARLIRYCFLFTQAKKYKAQAVAVGHTADDQVETILMHILRGTGLSGLRGMLPYCLPNTWSDTIPLIRPLLGIWRKEVMGYCNDNRLIPLLDKSNLDLKYFRNRIRHELIPMLEENYNPRAKKALWQMANTLAGEHELLNTYFEEIWESSEIECRKGQIHLKLNFLIAQPVAIQRLIVRRVVTTLNPNITDIDYQVTEKAVRFINDSSNPRSHNFDLCNDIHMVRENETLVIFYRERYISNLWPQLVGSGSIIYPIPGELYLQLKMENNETKTSAWRFISEWVEGSPKVLSEAKNNSDLYQAWLDLGGKENISSEMKFEIRMRRIGDKFRPLGLNGHSMKLSDFMVNIKLPNHARSGWPLICLNGEVIWIPGYRISHNYRITPATQLALRICLQRVGQVDLLGD